MLTHSCPVTLNGPIVISMNDLCESVMLLHYSDIFLSGNILFESNFCDKIVTLVSPSREAAYIEVMEYSNITFIQNGDGRLIVVVTDYDYYSFYPPCIFQYVTRQTTLVTSPSHYNIIISSDWLMNYLFTILFPIVT